MKADWPTVPLGNVIRQRKEFIRIDDMQTYKRPRVQLHAKGIIERDTVTGAEIKTKTQQVCRTGEFLVAEIDAKVGGFGVVPGNLEGSLVSSHYFLFQIDETKLDRQFLDFYSRTPTFREQVAAQGSTNYAAIRPGHVLGYTIPLPPVTEQRRIVARIEQLAAQIAKARRLRHQADEETVGLLGSALNTCFVRALKTVKTSTPIASFSTIFRGKGPIYKEGSGQLAVNQKCVRWNGVETIHAKEVSEEWAASLHAEYLLQEDDVVVNSTGEGTIGRTCVVSPRAVGLPFDSHVLALRSDKQIALSSYVTYFLCSPQGQTAIEESKGAKTTKQTELGASGLGKIALPLLPLDEQRRIVGYLDGLAGQVAALARLQSETASALDALLPSILDKAFKGRL